MGLKSTGPRNPRDNPAFTARYFEDTRTHDGREIKPLWGRAGSGDPPKNGIGVPGSALMGHRPPRGALYAACPLSRRPFMRHRVPRKGLPSGIGFGISRSLSPELIWLRQRNSRPLNQQAKICRPVEGQRPTIFRPQTCAEMPVRCRPGAPGPDLSPGCRPRGTFVLSTGRRQFPTLVILASRTLIDYATACRRVTCRQRETSIKSSRSGGAQ